MNSFEEESASVTIQPPILTQLERLCTLRIEVCQVNIEAYVLF